MSQTADPQAIRAASLLDRRKALMSLGATLGAASLSAPGALASGRKESIVINGLDTSVFNTGYLDLIRQGGVHCVHKSMSPGGGFNIAAARKFVEENSGEIMLATTARDIRQAYRDGKIALIMGFQNSIQYMVTEVTTKGPFATFNAMTNGLRENYELGLRLQGITYNATHFFGGGNLDDHVPLTNAGKRFVEEIHKLGIILDVGGHTGERTTLDAIEISKGVPVVATHTNVAALNNNLRADSDRVLEAIAGTGGVIGISAISDFHTRNGDNYLEHGPRSPQATLDMHLDQYDHVKRLVGIDHVGLGTDFVTGWEDVLIVTHDDNYIFPETSMSAGPPQLVKDFENISKLPNVIAGLRQRGWTQSELDKFLGGNWLRVYEKVWRE